MRSEQWRLYEGRDFWILLPQTMAYQRYFEYHKIVYLWLSPFYEVNYCKIKKIANPHLHLPLPNSITRSGCYS